MRLLPLLTAVLVTATLYAVIIQRDALMAFARGEGLDRSIAIARGEAEPMTAEAAEVPAAAGEPPAAGETAAAGTPAPAGEDAAPPHKPVRVVAIHSQAREIDGAVILRGQTEAVRQVELRAETSGRVISDPLRKGALVEAGELLCELDPGTSNATLAEAQARLAEARAAVPTSQARVEEARAVLEEAQINDNAARKLSEGGYASDTRVASTKAAVRSAEAAVASAESGLSSTQAAIQAAEANVAAATSAIDKLAIHAPFGGLLETDTAELGSLLQPGNVCATVIQLDPIKLVGFIPETEIGRVQTGARAGARLAADGREVIGKVTFLSRSSDPQTRTFRVEVEVANDDLSIRDGQTAEIGIEAEGALAHLLPQSALTLNDDGALGVRTVAADNTAAFVPVKLLRDTPQGVWLTGLEDKADVIVIGQEFVVAGVPVVPSYQEATQ